MEALLKDYIEKNNIEKLANHIKRGDIQPLITGLSGGAKPVFLKALQQSLEKPLLIVAPNLYQAQRIYENLTKMFGETDVYLYPAEELVAAEFSVSSYELRAQRIETVDHMVRGGKGIYITPIAGMRRLLPNKERWLKNSLVANLNDTIDIDEWLKKLTAMNYTRQEMVTAPGEFALRGGILDLYPPHLESPIRIELFDTDIDSIRTFSAEDQRSLEKLTTVSILPASEFVWSTEDLQAMAARLEEELAISLQKVSREEVKELLTMQMNHDIALMKEGNVPEGILKYASFAEDAPTSLGTYFTEEGIVVFDEIGRVTEVLSSIEAEEEEWSVSLIEEGKIVHGAKLSFTFNEINDMLKQHKIYLSLFDRKVPGVATSETITMSCKPMQQFQGQMQMLKTEVERWLGQQFTVYVLVDGEERMRKVQGIFEDYEIPANLTGAQSKTGGVFIIDGELSEGFEAPEEKSQSSRMRNYLKGYQSVKHVHKKYPMLNALKVILR